MRDASGATQSHNGISTKPTKIIHVEGLTAGSLMKHGGDNKQHTINHSNATEIADGELMSIKMSNLAGNSEKNKWENALEIEKKNMGSMGINMLRDNMDQIQKHTETEVAGICTFVKDKRKKSRSGNCK